MAPSLSLLTPALRVTPVHDGVVLESSTTLPAPAPTILDWLARWATERPDSTYKG